MKVIRAKNDLFHARTLEVSHLGVKQYTVVQINRATGGRIIKYGKRLVRPDRPAMACIHKFQAGPHVIKDKNRTEK